MKNLTVSLFAIALVLIGNNAFAQHDGPFGSSGWYMGVKGIPQMSWMLNSDDADNPNYKILTKGGAGFGLTTGYNFCDNIGIAADVLYSVQGRRYELYNVEYIQTIGYIKIPVMFSYTTNPAPFMFIGKIGPQAGFLTNADIEPNVVNSSDIQDNKEHFQSVEIGGVISAGGRYAITEKVWLDAGLRFDASLTNAEDSNYYPASRNKTHNINAGIEIGVVYLLR